MKIKDMPRDSRPRERMERYGIKVLSDAEVLSLIIQKGFKNENAIDVSNRLIGKYGVNKLSKLSLKQLQSVKGIGAVKAIQILASFDISRRLKNTDTHIHIKFAYQVYKNMKNLAELNQEHFIILMLNTKNKIIKEETIAIGTLDSTIIHPREIFKDAIKESASSIILVHNHPSGDPAPSEDDIRITKELIHAGDILNMPVLDHIIIGKGKYWSWIENGKL